MTTSDTNIPADGTFASLGMNSSILSSLSRLGYEEPTPVQLQAIPALLAGKDLLAQAATGTGKTAAFALPLLHSIAPDAAARERLTALILVPTRELAMQVAEAVHKYGKELGVVTLPVYGGASMENQIRALKRGVDVVVATPGRALDHIRRQTLRLSTVKTVVLDEADEMLDMGFAEDLEAILDATSTARQTALFSATIPPRIAALAGKYLKNPTTVRIDREVVAAGESPRVRQTAYVVPRAQKMTTLGRILDIEDPTSAIVFCRTRTEVDELTETLNARGFRAQALHGGLSQEQRDRVMKKFRANTADLLIATDVAARGLDIQHVSHVVNYDVPNAADAYVHRIGRTGRAGRDGVAITLAEPREHRFLRNIERVTGQKIEIAMVPSVADLQARRLELLQSSLRSAIVAGDLEQFRVLVEALSEEFDPMDVAAAAVKLADSGGRADGAKDKVATATGAAVPKAAKLRLEREAGASASIASAEQLPRTEYTPATDRKPRSERKARSDKPQERFKPRDGFKPRGEYKARGEYKPKGEYQPRGEYKGKGDYKARGEHKAKGEYKGRDEFKPRGRFKPRPEFEGGAKFKARRDRPEGAERGERPRFARGAERSEFPAEQRPSSAERGPRAFADKSARPAQRAGGFKFKKAVAGKKTFAKDKPGRLAKGLSRTKDWKKKG